MNGLNVKGVFDINERGGYGYTANRSGIPLFYQFTTPRTTQPLIVFINPLLEEQLFCRQYVVSWLRHLSNRGYNVLTFDYAGSGNSAGEYPLPADRMVDDLIDIIDWYQNGHPIQPLFLAGIRFGLNLALKATKQIQVDKIVGVEPILELEQYWSTLLRTNLTTQLSAYGKIITNRERLMEKLRGGERITLSGYEIDLQFYQSLLNFGLHDICGTVAKKTMLFLRTGSSRKISLQKIPKSIRLSEFNYEQVEMEPFWTDTIHYRPVQSALFKKTDEFLSI